MLKFYLISWDREWKKTGEKHCSQRLGLLKLVLCKTDPNSIHGATRGSAHEEKKNPLKNK